MNRRSFLESTTMAAVAAAALPIERAFAQSPAPQSSSKSKNRSSKKQEFWPNGAQIAISLSMQFEAGAQPKSGASSPFPAIDSKYPDLPATTWYEYGYKEGVQRLLDVWDRKGVKVTSHMVGAAVDLNPDLAKEIVQRGHEAAAHGQTWTPQFSMTEAEERASYEANIKSIEKATGTRPTGFNAFWLRGTPKTLSILQDLGFTYHIDNISRDEPFFVTVKGKPFGVVPYTLHTNDIVNYEERHQSTLDFATDLKNEFDMLFAEGTKRRRMMSISTHDRISGRPARAKVIEDFITYAQKHKGVWFARKDEIIKYAAESSLTPHEK